MSVSDFIFTATILEVNDSAEKSDLVFQLLNRLAMDGKLHPSSVPSLLEAVMRRESIASTGIGAGIAIPHAKHPAVSRRLGILGLCHPPVEFDSIDGERTDLVWLLLLPTDPSGYQSMRISPEVSLLYEKLRHATFRRRLRESTSEEEMRDILSWSEWTES